MADVHVTTYINLCYYIGENFVSISIETDTCVDYRCIMPSRHINGHSIRYGKRTGSFTLRVDDLRENVICLFEKECSNALFIEDVLRKCNNILTFCSGE